MKTFDAYNREARQFATYPNQGDNLEYAALGLCGEAGEFADKLKKAIRDDNGWITEERRVALAAELGDVLWYVACCARELGIPLADIAEANIEKLLSRAQRGKLQGSGDNR